MNVRNFFLCCYLLSASFFANSGLEEIQPLSFGTIVVLSNSQVESYVISKEGNVQLSSNLLQVTPGQRGLYRVFNITPNTNVILSTQILDGEFVSSELNTERFTFTSINTATVYRTDENGEVIIPVGGTLSTSGNGNLVYGNSALTADYLVEVSY